MGEVTTESITCKKRNTISLKTRTNNHIADISKNGKLKKNKAMNENLDLTKILKNCPKGTKFYSAIDGEVEFVEITQDKPALVCLAQHGGTFCYFKDGRFFKDKGECILFPSKKQRDWSKFEIPKPKVKVTLHPFDKVLGKDTGTNTWRADFIMNFEKGTNYPCRCISWRFKQCIPYNKDTAHLLGTKDNSPIDYEIEFSKEFKEE